jgi:hypothetical protein
MGSVMPRSGFSPFAVEKRRIAIENERNKCLFIRIPRDTRFEIQYNGPEITKQIS